MEEACILEQISYRITSYNVCYTKLLRIAENMECVLQTALTSMPIPILKEVSEMNNDKVAHNEKCQDNIQSDASITGITPKTTVIKQ